MRRIRVAALAAMAATALVASGAPGSARPASPAETRPAEAAAGERNFVHFRRGTVRQPRVLRSYGITPVRALRSVDVVYGTGPASAFRRLARDPRVTHLEPDALLPLLNDTSVTATRVAELRESPVLRDPAGAPLDGSGVGVAVIDTGILSAHPDLAPVVGKNYKIVCGTACPFVETPAGDTSSGHGTHVAGIVAGTGGESGGRFAGVAPGATLYGFGAGDTVYVLHAAAAFDYIVTHYDDFDPRIRVVTNSYGSPGDFDPDSAVSKLVSELIARGTTVVWAAGNSGGNGSADRVVDDAKNPLPGVIGVANYDDSDSGTRDGDIYSSSSRGRRGTPETYPDVAAPGTSITSTCIQELQPVCHFGFNVTTTSHPWYATIGGTSMAAPHVAGIAALLYQADPSLSPAQVEDLLQDSAYRFGDAASYEPDPQNPGGAISFDKGAGLVDAVGAMELLRYDPTPVKPPRKKKPPRAAPAR